MTWRHYAKWSIHVHGSVNWVMTDSRNVLDPVMCQVITLTNAVSFVWNKIQYNDITNISSWKKLQGRLQRISAILTQHHWVDWCAILIAYQIVMAKHGGSCVHFSGISTCGRTSRETVSHPQCPPLPTLCKISLPIYVIVTNKLLHFNNNLVWFTGAIFFVVENLTTFKHREFSVHPAPGPT